jgi:hypothetical protein
MSGAMHDICHAWQKVGISRKCHAVIAAAGVIAGLVQSKPENWLNRSAFVVTKRS